MDEIRLKIEAEPTDPYKKAEQDLFQALKSIQALHPRQRQQLLQSVFGVASVATAYEVLKQYFR